MSNTPHHAGRVGRAVTRGRRHLVRAAVALSRALPGRSTGAVAGPTEAVADTTTAWGWAHRRLDPVEAVVVLVDGRPAALATLGEERPDVAAARRGGRHSGWSARVDLPKRTSQAVLSALVITRSGLVERLNDLPVELRPRSDGGWITRPKANTHVVPGMVTLEGWTLPGTPPARIEVRVDGASAGLARPLALPQPDLAATSSLPWAPLAAFEHTVDLAGREPGADVRIDVDVVTLDGIRTAVGTVEIAVSAPRTRPDVPAAVRAVRDRVVAAARAHRADPGKTVRLLVVTHQLDLGGGQLYMFELLRHLLVELDISCLVISMTDGVLHEMLEDLGAFVHVCGRPSTTSPRDYESLLLELVDVVAPHECNVAFVNTMTAAFGADLATRLGIPTVWAVHESYSLDGFFIAAYGEGRLDPYMRERTAEALAATSAVVFEADATRQLYEPHGDPRRFVTIPYGIPLAEIDEYLARCDRRALRRAYRIADHETLLLCMGTYEPRKGQGALVLGFAELAEEFPNAVLALVGDTGIAYAKAVRETVERLRLNDRVRLLPVVDDTYAWYAMADAFVTVSDVESLPRSVLEVMAFGVPVLAADVFGLSELIDDGRTGLLCAPRDIGAMVGGLRRLLGATPEERAGLGAGGSGLVRARYDSSGYAAAYRRLLRGLLANPRSLPDDLLAP